MKNSPLYIAAAISILLLGSTMCGCKTNENNYRAAYEAAVAQRDDATGIDSTIYSKIRRSAVRTSLVAGTDTLPMNTEHLGYTEGGGSSRATIKPYNVVVGQFKQIFNARQMRQRLIDNGYAGAIILHTREPLYYVIAVQASTPEEASAGFHRVLDDHSMVLKEPLPFILHPAIFGNR